MAPRRATTASAPGASGKSFPFPGSCQTTVETGAKSGKTVSPVTGSRSVERRQRAEAQAVQVHGLEVVVVDDEILVALVGAFLRGLAAAAGIDFLDHESAGRGMRQPQVHDAPLRDHHLVRRAVEEVFPRSVAAGNAVDARRNLDFRKAAAVGPGQVRGAGGNLLNADDRAFVDGIGIAVRIDGVH